MEVGKWMVAIVSLSLYGGVIADAVVPHTAKQHLRNPRWPPHAKFHNAQSMLMGTGLGTLAIVILFAVRPLTFPVFLIATGVAAMYYAAMALATVFPGTAWYDPEFEGSFKRPFGLHPQQLLGYLMLLLLVVAVLLAARS